MFGEFSAGLITYPSIYDNLSIYTLLNAGPTVPLPFLERCDTLLLIYFDMRWAGKVAEDKGFKGRDIFVLTQFLQALFFTFSFFNL